VELANLQFEEDKPIDLRALKMRGNLHERDSIAHLLGVWLKNGVHSENIEEMAKEYNDLLAVDYDEDNWDHEREAALFVEKVNLNNTSDEEIKLLQKTIHTLITNNSEKQQSDKLKKEGWSLLTRLEKDLGYTREQTMEKLSDVLQLYEKNY